MKNKPNRPNSVTWLLVGVLILTGLHWLRFAAALADWRFLSTLPLKVPPAYLALTGLAWGLVGAWLLWALWNRLPAAPDSARLAALVFALYYWVDRLWLAAAGPQSTNQPFALIATVLLVAWVFVLLARPAIRAYFGADYE